MEIVSRSYNHSRSHSRSIPSHEIVAMETIVSSEIKPLLIEQIHSESRSNPTAIISSSNQKKSSLWKSSLPSKIAGSKNSRPKIIANHTRSRRSLLRLGVRNKLLSRCTDETISYQKKLQKNHSDTIRYCDHSVSDFNVWWHLILLVMMIREIVLVSMEVANFLPIRDSDLLVLESSIENYSAKMIQFILLPIYQNSYDVNFGNISLIISQKVESWNFKRRREI